jgi:Kef-type K+ transport system membrane component KefB
MMKFLALIAAVLLLAASPAFASAGAGGAEPIAAVCLLLAIILGAAKLGGDLAVRIGQPAVLGELVVGVVLGNLQLLGFSALEPFKHDSSLELLAQLGVIILLFEVGLESTVAQMMRVGLSSFLVASVGVVAPFALGWGVSAWLQPQASTYVHAFIGATLTATSVGITARVLKDLDRSQTDEARIILGAAVIDDVLGLVVLAVVTGVIAAADQGTTISSWAIALILIKALAFLAGSLVIGLNISPRIFALASRLKSRGVLLGVGLSFCFTLSWIASAIGLAPIVGAFAAGLILEQVHYRDFTSRGEHQLEELVQPISAFLVPVFFVLMGMHTDLASFARLEVLGLAGALVVAAIIGKQACYVGVTGRGIDRLTVGLGMIPRGEVGLIFANIGLTLTVNGERVVDSATYSAIVIMVIVTTMVTPPLLKWSVNRPGRSS